MKRPIPLLIVTLWFGVTAVSAYIYAYIGVHSPIAVPGYETDWYFHLWMFALFILPFFVGALVLVLWLEGRLRRHKQQSASPRN